MRRRAAPSRNGRLEGRSPVSKDAVQNSTWRFCNVLTVSTAPPKGKTVVRNIGLMLSGDLAQPILDANCIVAVDGRIDSFGKEADLNTAGADTVIDAAGTTLAPGLIDSHVHPVFGD